MMKPFKVGELVRVFIDAKTVINGTVYSECEDGWTVYLDTPLNYSCYFKAHPKQIRRLVKKPAREWTLTKMNAYHAFGIDHGPNPKTGETVTVREVKVRK